MENINCCQTKFEDCAYSKKLLDVLFTFNTLHKNKINILEVKKALYYAKEYHGNQIRKSGEPYYSHPVEVAIMVANHTALKAFHYFRTDIIVVSLLHDCLEDTNLTYNDITDIFGKTIANKVNDLTRIKPDKKISAAETLSLLFPQNKKDLLLIKLFDRLHNVRTLEFMPAIKIINAVNETLGYFIPLAIHLNMKDVEEELTALCYKHITDINLPEQKNLPLLLRCLDNPSLSSLISRNGAIQ